jgi:hypothetical protein
LVGAGLWSGCHGPPLDTRVVSKFCHEL